MLTAGYEELPVTSHQAAMVSTLPPIHRDPFDRLLIAQAITESLTVVTADTIPGTYPAPVILV